VDAVSFRPMAARFDKITDDPANFWLKASIPGWFVDGNLEALEHCIRHLESEAPVIEIGTHAGLSTSFITRLLRNHGRTNKVFSADAWTFSNYPTQVLFDDVTCARYRGYLVEAYRRNVELFQPDDKPFHLELDSDDFLAAWSSGQAVTTLFGDRVTLGGPMSLVYIDGSHYYEQCLRDFQNVDRHLDVGGFIVFDDSSKDAEIYHPGSRRVAVEAAALPRYRVVLENPNLTIERVG
jgi:predicted O-methyltransferase YrrM